MARQEAFSARLIEAMARTGMKQTDVEILNLMIGKTKIEDIEK